MSYEDMSFLKPEEPRHISSGDCNYGNNRNPGYSSRSYNEGNKYNDHDSFNSNCYNPMETGYGNNGDSMMERKGRNCNEEYNNGFSSMEGKNAYSSYGQNYYGGNGWLILILLYKHVIILLPINIIITINTRIITNY